MLNSVFTKFQNTFLFTSVEEKLYSKFQTSTSKKTDTDTENILLQCVEDLYYYNLFGLIITALRNKNNIVVDQYVQRNLTLGATSTFSSFVKSILVNNRVRDNKWVKLYSSYCNNVAYRHEGSSSLLFNLKAWVQAYKIYKSISSRDDILGVVVDDIEVGDLIYDSYLRFKPAATVDINDFYLCVVIWQSIRNIAMTKKYFLENKPSILLTSYSTYIQHGMAVRIALLHNTKVYSFGNYQTFTKRIEPDYLFHTSNFTHYKQNFVKKQDKDKLLEVSKASLEAKLGGHIDNATAYMKHSAYKLVEMEVPNIKGCIVIFLHDFFDSPHVYGNMIFPDFLQWVKFTIKVCDEKKIPYVLKAHPNEVGDSKKIIKELKVQYPKANFISPKITNKQLIEHGMKLGVSVYGTVSHELVYMGIPVILCGANPHSSYSFCYEAKTKDEYMRLLVDYKDLKLIDNAKEEVKSFYYMHNLNQTKQQVLLNKNSIELRKYMQDNTRDIDIKKYESMNNKIIENNEFQLMIEGMI